MSDTTKKTSILATYASLLPSLRRSIAKYVVRSEDIDDIVQESFCRAFAAEKAREIRSPKAYLHTVARNIALNELNKKSASIQGFIEELIGPDVVSNEPFVDEQVYSRLQFESFVLAIAELPPQCRKVFLLRKIYGLTHKEISAKLNISTSTVEKHLAIGLSKCSIFMAQEGYSRDKLKVAIPARRTEGQLK